MVPPSILPPINLVAYLSCPRTWSRLRRSDGVSMRRPSSTLIHPSARKEPRHVRPSAVIDGLASAGEVEVLSAHRVLSIAVSWSRGARTGATRGPVQRSRSPRGRDSRRARFGQNDRTTGGPLGEQPTHPQDRGGTIAAANRREPLSRAARGQCRDPLEWGRKTGRFTLQVCCTLSRPCRERNHSEVPFGVR